jgi:acetyl-CoA acetyltransferase
LAARASGPDIAKGVVTVRECVVVGVGLHRFGRFPEKPIDAIGRDALLDALDDAGMAFKDIEIAYCGHYASGDGYRVIRQIGLTGIPIVNVENACASGSTAFREALWAVASGMYDVAVATGFEKMRRGIEGRMPQLTPQDRGFELRTYEGFMGTTAMPATYAMAARKHMEAYGSTAEQFAQVAVKDHLNGAQNPNAQYRTPLTLDEVLNSRMICDPLTLYMCAPTSDGASAVIICSREKARQYTLSPVSVAGWATGTPAYSPTGNWGDLDPRLAQRLSAEAYAKAGIGPRDIDVLQVHDAFSPAEVMLLESLGFCPEGEGARWVWEGRTTTSGTIPTNTDGGLVARGHPMGATGIAQIAEIIWQLTDRAGRMCHNMGPGACNIHILKR